MTVIGEIKSITGNIAKVEVVEQETNYDCYMLQPLTGKIKIDLPYSVGDQVVCMIQSGRNIIIGAIYNDIDTRDSEAEFEKVLINSNKLTTKTIDETKMRASKFDIANNAGISLKTCLNEFIDEVMKIIVVSGTTPNVPVLQAIKLKINQMLK